MTVYDGFLPIYFLRGCASRVKNWYSVVIGIFSDRDGLLFYDKVFLIRKPAFNFEIEAEINPDIT